jgi:phospholipase D1/2
MCVIDQQIGFMGGLDICYGRWDTPEHKLVENVADPNKRFWDGGDYNNFRTSDIYEPRKYEKSNLNKDFQVRMPWHDIALQMRGDCVIDLMRHFIQYWYFVKSEYKFSPRKILQSFQGYDKTMQKRDFGKHMK